MRNLTRAEIPSPAVPAAPDRRPLPGGEMWVCNPSGGSPMCCGLPDPAPRRGEGKFDRRSSAGEGPWVRNAVLSLAVLVAAAPLFAADYPMHTLKSDALTVTVYLPDAEKGFYRGTRFDWAGVASVEFAGHKLFGPWKDKHDPKNNDDIVGPAEEFGMNTLPLGYTDAKVGGRFLKIGVGELEKPKEEKYRFFHNYKIAKAGEWVVDKGEAKVTFTQTLKTDFGYAYTYTKVLTVSGAEMRILHVLENTGPTAIGTDHYNHNFFNVDGATVGSDYELEFPFAPTADAPKDRFAELVKLDGKKLTLGGPLDKGSIYAALGGFSTAAGSTDAAVTLRHKPTKVAVRVSGDKPPKAFNVWGMTTTLCPEPFVQLDVEPGKKVTWSWRYVFEKGK